MNPNLSLLLCCTIMVLTSCGGPKQSESTPTIVIGDPYPDAANAVGVVYAVSEDGKHGMVVSKDEISLAWSTSTIATKATDVENGMQNMHTIQSKANWETTYPAFKWCADKGTGWYLPSKKELKMIFAGRHGLNWMASGADESKKEVNDWGDNISMRNSGKHDHNFFDNQLRAIGGVRFCGSNIQYISSSEYDANNNWEISDTGLTSYRNNKTEKYYSRVRCVKAF